MTARRLQLPEDAREAVARRFGKRRGSWLTGDETWPLTIFLGTLTESDAGRHREAFDAWIAAWRNWSGPGTLEWEEKRWRTLGVMRLPHRLAIASPDDAAAMIGQAQRWRIARERHARLCERWPRLTGVLSRWFDALADETDADLQRIEAFIAWIESNPASGLYPRQLPIPGLDTKWLETRRALLGTLIAQLRETALDETNGDDDDVNGAASGFCCVCCLRQPPGLIRMRLLDPDLRARAGGLGDISAPADDWARMNLPTRRIFIVENLQTGLAFEDLPGAAIIMGLGYGVDALTSIKWIGAAPCYYWGDLDTHGFAILNRARSRLPGLRSILMDDATLLRHQDFWVEEPRQHPASSLPLLTEQEQALYKGLKDQRWGVNVRLEQERIAWSDAWATIQACIFREREI